ARNSSFANNHRRAVTMNILGARRGVAGAVVALALVATAPAGAETLRVGKAVVDFAYVPIDIGVAAGIFKKNGIEIESYDFTGGSKQQQALTAGSLRSE